MTTHSQFNSFDSKIEYVHRFYKSNFGVASVRLDWQTVRRLSTGNKKVNSASFLMFWMILFG